MGQETQAVTQSNTLIRLSKPSYLETDLTVTATKNSTSYIATKVGINWNDPFTAL